VALDFMILARFALAFHQPFSLESRCNVTVDDRRMIASLWRRPIAFSTENVRYDPARGLIGWLDKCQVPTMMAKGDGSNPAGDTKQAK
jgi:hypothetical protein